jgi:hypothetical protein
VMLVDQTAQHVAVSDPWEPDGQQVLVVYRRVGNGQRQAAVRSLLVLVTDIGTQQPQQMAPANHQRPVPTL